VAFDEGGGGFLVFMLV